MKSIAIIGCGRISARHVKAAVENKAAVNLAAVCDLVPQNAGRAAAEYAEGMAGACREPQVFLDYREMLKQGSGIDAVSICTESGYHAKIAIDCLRQGKHVIVEKPMALSLTDADEMIEVAGGMGAALGVCFQNRFNPPVQKLRKALEEGRFGKIISVTARILWNRGKPYYEQAPWRGTYALDGGCLMNQCIHNIDLLQWILSYGKGQASEAVWVNGEVGNYMHSYIEAEDYGSVQVKYNSGAMGNIEGTVCAFPQNLEETLTVMGENGIAEIGGLALNAIKVWRFKDGLEDEEDVKARYSGEVADVYGYGHTAFYRDFFEAIKQGRRPYIDGPSGRKAVEIVLAAYKSSRGGHRVMIPVLEDITTAEFGSR